MNKFGIVLGHTYFTRLKSRAFIITTLVIIGFVYLFANLPTIISFFMNDDVEEIAIIDHSNVLFDPLKEDLEVLLEGTELVLYTESEASGKDAVIDGDIAGLLVLDLDETGFPVAQYYTNDAIVTQNETMIIQELQQIKTMTIYEQVGVDAGILASLNEPFQFEKTSLDESAKTEEEMFQAQGIIYIMLFMLYLTVTFYGQMIATDVATEKSSRVMEILISSASPVTHMFAKIAGIALLGLTQIVIIFGAGIIFIRGQLESEVGEFFEIVGFTDVSISIFIYAILFFILGYLLYATIAAMLGSLVSRVEDVSNLTLPMVLLLAIGFMIAIFGLNTPDATFITITSYIPFFTPMIMFLRIGMLDVPIWEISLSIGILIGSIILLGWLGARIYRGGVLMYGPSRSLKDFSEAFQLTRKEK